MASNSIYIVDIMGAIVAATNVALTGDKRPEGYTPNIINYTYGDKDEIMGKVSKLQGNQTTKSRVFPYVGITMPFKEQRGVKGDFYGIITFPEIIIAMRSNGTDDFPQRYQKVMKPIVYPIYEEFLRQIAKSGKFIGVQSIRNIQHDKYDQPDFEPFNSNLNEHTDALLITNLTLTANQSVC